jgi:ATP-dependent Clp protease ATP-binding subunit ClpX
LSENALLSILTEPKNALLKQYKKLFMLEGVELDFEDDELNTVVKKATDRGTGARALRSIIEETMLDIMYHLPTHENLVKCILTKESILKKKDPVYEYGKQKATA